MASNSILSDLVAAALVTAAFGTPVAAYVAYSNHTEALARLNMERVNSDRTFQMARERQHQQARLGLCTQAVTFLGDERTNPALPAPQRVLLVEDMRQNAAACRLGPQTLGDDDLSGLKAVEERAR
jgi:hypothetical protein